MLFIQSNLFSRKAEAGGISDGVILNKGLMDRTPPFIKTFALPLCLYQNSRMGRSLSTPRLEEEAPTDTP
ncbi:MAG: hypothetical protein LBH75_04600 [Treponema sp.]|jgi:hypothetical protein|nr:hypothetical protein [Treponema sp.]